MIEANPEQIFNILNIARNKIQAAVTVIAPANWNLGNFEIHSPGEDENFPHHTCNRQSFDD